MLRCCGLRLGTFTAGIAFFVKIGMPPSMGQSSDPDSTRIAASAVCRRSKKGSEKLVESIRWAEEAFPLAVIRSLLILFAIALVKLSFALRVVLVFRNERRKILRK